VLRFEVSRSVITLQREFRARFRKDAPAGASFLNSEMCHSRCVFKLYGEVNSVKNTTINMWLNDGVY